MMYVSVKANFLSGPLVGNCHVTTTLEFTWRTPAAILNKNPPLCALAFAQMGLDPGNLKRAGMCRQVQIQKKWRNSIPVLHII